MALQDGATSTLAYVAETAQGTTPTTPTMLNLRTTDPGGIQKNKNILESEESFAHRQKQDVRHGFESVQGQIPAELSYEALDDWIAAALGGAWSTETAGTPEVLSIGNNINTFSVERLNPTISQYEVFRGVNPNQLSLSIQPENIVGITFDVVGMGFDAAVGTSLGSPTDVANHSPFDSFSGSIKEGGSAIAIITGLDFQLVNGRTVQPRIGDKESPQVFDGTAVVTGTVTAWFEDAVLIDKFKNETESSLEVTLDDETGTYQHVISIPRVKYTGQDQDVPDEGPVVLSLPFQGLYDQTATTTLKWTRNNPA